MMIRSTYRGRKIKVVKGGSRDYGYSLVTLNGTSIGRWQGREDVVMKRVCGYIDGVDQEGVNGNRYGAEWYVPGTFEICENGHPRVPGTLCLHTWCQDH